ncbi:MAG: hypothetical protein IJ042_01980 [Butyricicoccus sp.]|nr:hypothetical protein [Butyricicoccus sp.]
MIGVANHIYIGKLTEIDRAVSLLLQTRIGSVPLDREFGIEMDFVDRPIPVTKTLYTAEVTEKISKYIPEVRVQDITWTHSENGLIPKVVIEDA